MISAIGISCVDHLLTVDGFKSTEGLYQCESYCVDGGGMAATALCAASKLGSSARLFSRLGNDINGQFILDGLKKFNVDTSGMVQITGKNSFVSIILVDSKTGEKQFYAEKNQLVFKDYIDLDVTLLKSTDVLLVDGFWMDAAIKGVKWASEHTIPIVGDINNTYNGLDTILPHVNYLIIPEFFARKFTTEQTISEMLRSLKPMIAGIPVITQGSQGGVYFVENKVQRYKAFPVQCIDSTGAGDAFHGAFCHFLSCGLSIDRCLELASAVGAMNCRSPGGRAGLPTKEELSDFLAMHGSDPELP